MADIPAANWHTVDDANIEAAPDGLPEGCMPSGVNNWARATMGSVKRWYTRTVPVTTAGSASAFTMTYSVAPGALYDGESFTVLFHVANAASATLNISALGAKPLHYYSSGAWRAIPAALLGANQIGTVAYHNSSAAYRLLDLPDRTGEVVAFAGATAPAGSLFCFGQAVSRTAYAGLFAALSTAHGVGDGSTTFNLPDLRGRVAAGKGNMGGTESGRLNTYVASTLGAAGGAQTSTTGTITSSGSNPLNLGNFAFNFTSATAKVNAASASGLAFGGSGVAAQLNDAVSITAISGFTTVSNNASISVSGTSDAFRTVQPTMALNYVIRI